MKKLQKKHRELYSVLKSEAGFLFRMNIERALTLMLYYTTSSLGDQLDGTGWWPFSQFIGGKEDIQTQATILIDTWREQMPSLTLRRLKGYLADYIHTPRLQDIHYGNMCREFQGVWNVNDHESERNKRMEILKYALLIVSTLLIGSPFMEHYMKTGTLLIQIGSTDEYVG